MAVSFQPPKILSAQAMFAFWAENLKKEKPHLILKRMSGKYTEIWNELDKELEYLINRNLELDAKIQHLEVLDKSTDEFTPLTKEIFQMKKEIVLNRQKIIRLQHKIKGKEVVMDYMTFKKIVSCFNKKAADALIKGELLYLGNNLGYSQVRKIVPLIRKNKIDWKATTEYKKELITKGTILKSKINPKGANWLIYKNDPWYLRWSWIKHYTSTHSMICKVKNNRVYAFYPTNSDVDSPGNKTKLALANQADPLLHTRYFTLDLKESYAKKKLKDEKLYKLEETIQL